MKGRSLLEVLAVVLFKFVVLGWLFAQAVRAGLSHWGQYYLNGVLLIAVPLGLLLITRRDLAAYGLTLRNWRQSLDLGMTCYVVRMIPWLLGFGLMGVLHVGYASAPGALILVITYEAATWVLLTMLQRRRAGPQRPPNTALNLALLVVLLALPILAAWFIRRLNWDIASTVVWQFVFSGFGEEIYWRGWMQSRINQEFGRPYRVLGVNFGLGLIVSALMFGLAHMLNPFHPFEGQYGLAPWWGVWTVAGGAFFGLVREATDSIIGPGVAHGLPDAVGEGFGALFGWM